jgi:hypothetical protein
MLRSLGVDVFKDLRWDTWVVLHLVNRISVNFLAHPLAAGVKAEDGVRVKVEDGVVVKAEDGLDMKTEGTASVKTEETDDVKMQDAAGIKTEDAAGGSGLGSGDPAGGEAQSGALGTAYSLGLLLPLFNHACDPNLTTEDGVGGRVIKARRAIKKGEELTVNDVDLGLSKAERDTRLKCWFDSCCCDDCKQGE